MNQRHLWKTECYSKWSQNSGLLSPNSISILYVSSNNSRHFTTQDLPLPWGSCFLQTCSVKQKEVVGCLASVTEASVDDKLDFRPLDGYNNIYQQTVTHCRSRSREAIIFNIKMVFTYIAQMIRDTRKIVYLSWCATLTKSVQKIKLRVFLLKLTVNQSFQNTLNYNLYS